MSIKQIDPKKTFHCDKCSTIARTKRELKLHIKADHQMIKEIKCEDCDKKFHEHWELEVHSEEHNKENKFNCAFCDKTFLLEWRLNKHLENHEKKSKICCHYFNNNKRCPFEDIGCMFLHEKSKLCKNLKCQRILCQFRHIKIISTVKTNEKVDFALQNKEAKKSCDQCETKFTEKEHLLKHIKDVHENHEKTGHPREKSITFSCNQCEYQTIQKEL